MSISSRDQLRNNLTSYWWANATVAYYLGSYHTNYRFEKNYTYPLSSDQLPAFLTKSGQHCFSSLYRQSEKRCT